MKKTIEQSVAEIDAARQQYFERSPDRPQGRARLRIRKPAEVVKAESRLRTAAWRADLDKRGRPESNAVAVQLLICLIEVARDAGFDVADLPETKRAFGQLFAVMAQRGFQRTEVEAVIRRMTRRIR